MDSKNNGWVSSLPLKLITVIAIVLSIVLSYRIIKLETKITETQIQRAYEEGAIKTLNYIDCQKEAPDSQSLEKLRNSDLILKCDNLREIILGDKLIQKEKPIEE